MRIGISAKYVCRLYLNQWYHHANAQDSIAKIVSKIGFKEETSVQFAQDKFTREISSQLRGNCFM